MSKVDPFTRESNEILGTYDDDPTVEEVRMQELQCREEGHYVRVWATDLDSEDRTNPTYFAECTCGEATFYDEAPRDDEPMILRSLDELRMWAREHREAHGLPWQQWLGHVPAIFYRSMHWADEGHCVGAGPISEEDDASGEGGWGVLCSCALEADDLEEVKRLALRVESEEEAELWAAEHRGQHGLAPQPVLPPKAIAAFGWRPFV